MHLQKIRHEKLDPTQAKFTLEIINLIDRILRKKSLTLVPKKNLRPNS